MIRTLYRVRGASALGARRPGDRGPFSPSRAEAGHDQDDEEHDDQEDEDG